VLAGDLVHLPDKLAGVLSKIPALVLGLGLLVLLGCGSPEPATLRVYAAASTREALEEVVADFRKQTGHAVELNWGPSSELARQIEHGADADLFLSADEAWVNYLAGKDLCATRRDLLTNRLVVIVPTASELHLHALEDLARPEVRHLALAAPAVPAGRYARDALQHAGLWDRVHERVIDAADVRAALVYVARREAEVGMVYATDAAVSRDVRIALQVRPEEHTPIRYPLALVRREAARPAARQLYDYLGGPEAAAVFRKAGFGVLPGP
jgi:molybdate transport system substrate-binding protein